MGIVWEDSEWVIPNKTEGQCVLACPICKGRNLHILEVDVHRGTDKISITNKNVSIDESINESRGVIVDVEYEGECGGYWRPSGVAGFCTQRDYRCHL